jgi:aspartate oxidase
MNDEYYVAIVTPVVHYTMGGLNVQAKRFCRVHSLFARATFARIAYISALRFLLPF